LKCLRSLQRIEKSKIMVNFVKLNEVDKVEITTLIDNYIKNSCSICPAQD